MYTIGQLSRICKVSAKALRHYEKLGLLVPAQVGRDNLYRYYARDQVPVLRKIILLKDLGIPLKDVKRLVDEKTSLDETQRLLEDHREALVRQIDLCNSRLIKLSRWKNTLEANKVTENIIDYAAEYDIRIKEVQEVRVWSQRKQLKPFPENIAPFIREVLEDLVSRGGECAGPPVMLYHDEEFNPDLADVEVAWPVAVGTLSNRTLPTVRAAACLHVGPYGGLEAAYQAIFAWVNQNGYRAVSPIREISYNDPRTTSPDQLVTEIIIPVEKV